jgi:hypothetical protein
VVKESEEDEMVFILKEGCTRWIEGRKAKDV